RGRVVDSHDYAREALSKGAALVVCERALGIEGEVLVRDGRESFALLSANLHGNAARRLHITAVTGTNGKTTVSTLIKQLLEGAGHTVGVIGTMYSQIDQMEIPAKYTTPEAGDLHALFARMEQAGCTHVVMEASSQALAQKRLFGIQFKSAVFTNLTQDHLDYHGTMEDYFLAKRQLFFQCEHAAINIDDPYGQRLAAQGELPCPVTTFSDKLDEADYTARGIELHAGNVRFEMVGKGFIHRVRFPMPGLYSCQNALAAAVAAILAGVAPATACEGLSNSRGVRGRCEVLYNKKFTVICDFAHTADGIENVLAGLAPFAKGRVVVLFGCAGDRDAAKRPPMARAACKYADIVVLSSDNPRSEDPYKILGEVEPYLKGSGKPYYVQADRRVAITFALGLLQEDDLLVLCGKGHEDYQVIDGVTVYLDEHRIVADWLLENGLTEG
ncbi:UDP-N-acetylmuramoyl-L-alanyl-D-glutamate--2,6-diaminopimelate ligase, partial [Ruminococcaceae bacterium OttesenSCG-928-N02]|nr:UDP-N-acetylmuramoyl-L-alanyl-D-glutamate--2,6-diaminopimelate ligase [Ruminococcaceae bacterium OttesenSCG-928-N02]